MPLPTTTSDDLFILPLKHHQIFDVFAEDVHRVSTISHLALVTCALTIDYAIVWLFPATAIGNKTSSGMAVGVLRDYVGGMNDALDWVTKARASWTNRGQQRPPFARQPQAGQESVWDYPRPPKVIIDSRHVTVTAGDVPIVDSTASVRVLETASPPTFYFPPADVNVEVLNEAPGASLCEWKGEAKYWALGPEKKPIGWNYPDPYEEFERIRGWFSFYPERAQCRVDDEVVRPQPGGFYGGWMTDEIVGPVKGEPGSQSW